MAAQRESSVEDSEWAGISESGDDDMDFEVRSDARSGWLSFFCSLDGDCGMLGCGFVDGN